ncbi:MAG: LysR family transcriptional regulator [Armatimonadetes bacterium]|nr:LysR family transcriptional regulator [Armatimonadota bacterium]
MTLQQLRVFQAVARRGSYSRAAEELRISQPGVSAHVKELERQIGVELLEQMGRKVYLTEGGRILLSHADVLLMAASEARSAMEEFRGMERGRVVVAASTTPGTFVLPPVLGRLKQRYPGVDLFLRIADTEQVVRWLLANESDFGVLGEPCAPPELVVRPLATDTLVLVVRPGHPFADREAVRGDDLAAESLILREPGSSTRAITESSLRSAGISYRVAMELGCTEAIKQAIRAGLGIGILSRLTVADELARGVLKEVTIEGVRIQRQFGLAYHRRKHLTAAARALMSLLGE